MDNTGSPCFYYHIHKCKGACIKKESVEDYNERVQNAIEYLTLDFDGNFFLIDEGRSHDERAVVLVEDGLYQGFGYAEINTDQGDFVRISGQRSKCGGGATFSVCCRCGVPKLTLS